MPADHTALAVADGTRPVAAPPKHGSRASRLHPGLAHHALLVVQGSSTLVGWQVTASTGRPTPQEQLMHHARRVYDRSLLGFCYVIDSLSVSLSYKAVNPIVTHPWLAVQLFVPHDCKKLSIELGMNDLMESNHTKIVSKRRFFLSTATKEVKSTPLHASLPLESMLPREEWTTLLFNLNAIVSSAYRGCRFRSLETISIQGDKIKLRNIYTLRSISASGADEAAPSSSRSSTSLSLSTVSSIGEPIEIPTGFSASQLDASVPRQLAYPFTMTSCTSWVLIGGGPELCQRFQPQTTSESSLRPGQLKKADSGLSISLSPSASLASLSAPISGMLEYHHQAHASPLDNQSHPNVKPPSTDPSLLSMVDRVRRRKAVLERMNESSSSSSTQASQQQQQSHAKDPQWHSRPEKQPPQPSAMAHQLPVFPSAIPRPTGGFTGRGPILAPITRPSPPQKREASTTEVDNVIDALVDPYDLEVQQAVERALRKVQIHAAESTPTKIVPMKPNDIDFESKVAIRTDSGAKSKTPTEVTDYSTTGNATCWTGHQLALSGNDTAPEFATAERLRNGELADTTGDGGDEEGSIELVYDAAVGAYFDPQTNKYFLVQD